MRGGDVNDYPTKVMGVRANDFMKKIIIIGLCMLLIGCSEEESLLNITDATFDAPVFFSDNLTFSPKSTIQYLQIINDSSAEGIFIEVPEGFEVKYNKTENYTHIWFVENDSK